MRTSRLTQAGPTVVRPASMPLAGRRIMLVEFEALVAIDLEMTLQDAGACVEGPYLKLRDATEAARRTSADAAVLDVRMGRQDCGALAGTLADRGIALVFHTTMAKGARDILARHPAAGFCAKPCTPASIVRTIAGVVCD